MGKNEHVKTWFTGRHDKISWSALLEPCGFIGDDFSSLFYDQGLLQCLIDLGQVTTALIHVDGVVTRRFVIIKHCG